MYTIGLCCKKVGCSTLHSENGRKECITLLHLESAQVIEVSKDGKWDIVKVGFGEVKSKHLSKPLIGMFNKLSLPLKKKIMGFKVHDKELPKVGDVLTVNQFAVGQFVDVSGRSIGKGFAGAMKRHGFAGLRASHGVSISHRSHGSTGACQDPGHVIKGKKMAGRMGNKVVTVQNLCIVHVDDINSLIVVKGSVPGAKNSCVVVRHAVKKI